MRREAKTVRHLLPIFSPCAKWAFCLFFYFLFSKCSLRNSLALSPLLLLSTPYSMTATLGTAIILCCSLRSLSLLTLNVHGTDLHASGGNGGDVYGRGGGTWTSMLWPQLTIMQLSLSSHGCFPLFGPPSMHTWVSCQALKAAKRLVWLLITFMQRKH